MNLAKKERKLRSAKNIKTAEINRAAGRNKVEISKRRAEKGRTMAKKAKKKKKAEIIS